MTRLAMCIDTSDTKSNPNSHTKQHVIVSTQLNSHVFYISRDSYETVLLHSVYKFPLFLSYCLLQSSSATKSPTVGSVSLHELDDIKSVHLRLRNDLYCVEWGVKLYSLTRVLIFCLTFPQVVGCRVFVP